MRPHSKPSPTHRKMAAFAPGRAVNRVSVDFEQRWRDECEAELAATRASRQQRTDAKRRLSDEETTAVRAMWRAESEKKSALYTPFDVVTGKAIHPQEAARFRHFEAYDGGAARERWAEISADENFQKAYCGAAIMEDRVDLITWEPLPTHRLPLAWQGRAAAPLSDEVQAWSEQYDGAMGELSITNGKVQRSTEPDVAQRELEQLQDSVKAKLSTVQHKYEDKYGPHARVVRDKPEDFVEKRRFEMEARRLEFSLGKLKDDIPGLPGGK